jgi:hypothetical protein
MKAANNAILEFSVTYRCLLFIAHTDLGGNFIGVSEYSVDDCIRVEFFDKSLTLEKAFRGVNSLVGGLAVEGRRTDLPLPHSAFQNVLGKSASLKAYEPRTSQ